MTTQPAQPPPTGAAVSTGRAASTTLPRPAAVGDGSDVMTPPPRGRDPTPPPSGGGGGGLDAAVARAPAATLDPTSTARLLPAEPQATSPDLGAVDGLDVPNTTRASRPPSVASRTNTQGPAAASSAVTSVTMGQRGRRAVGSPTSPTSPTSPLGSPPSGSPQSNTTGSPGRYGPRSASGGPVRGGGGGMRGAGPSLLHPPTPTPTPTPDPAASTNNFGAPGSEVGLARSRSTSPAPASGTSTAVPPLGRQQVLRIRLHCASGLVPSVPGSSCSTLVALSVQGSPGMEACTQRSRVVRGNDPQWDGDVFDFMVPPGLPRVLHVRVLDKDR